LSEEQKMRRRDLFALLGGGMVAAWPLVARAQLSVKVPRIGIIDNAPAWDSFRGGLRSLGYIEGQNITFEYRTAEGKPDRLATAAAELVRIPVDVIVTQGTPPTAAAKQATNTIPIVMIGIGDPVWAGFAASLPRPGGNITGNTILGPDVAAKRLQLIKEVLPFVSRVAFLWNPDNASHAPHLEALQVAAPTLGLKLLPAAVRSSDGFDSAFAAIKSEHADAFLMTADPLHQLSIVRIIDFMANNQLPAMYQMRENVEAGGLISYGASLPDLYRRAATYVDKILRGAKPADLPVEQPIAFELAINIKTAKELGLAISPTLLARADAVIE
jgi:putative tryptophan/tyrosine transport system substrate-binding protein